MNAEFSTQWYENKDKAVIRDALKWSVPERLFAFSIRSYRCKATDEFHDWQRKARPRLALPRAACSTLTLRAAPTGEIELF